MRKLLATLAFLAVAGTAVAQFAGGGALSVAVSAVTGLGTGIATALGINIGSAGAPVLFNGAGGTPSSLTLTTATGLPTTGLTTNSSGTFPACGSGVIGERCLVQALNTSGTATFTNDSANIVVATNTPTLGAVVNLTTSSALPTNFATGTNYYVVSVSGTTITLSATPAGTAILAGSAGTGTQTANNWAVLSTGGVQDIGYVTLGAGLWHCNASTAFVVGATTTVTFIGGTINIASNTLPPIGSPGRTLLTLAFTTGVNQNISDGSSDFGLTTPTKVYFAADATFAVSTMYGVGTLSCLRAG